MHKIICLFLLATTFAYAQSPTPVDYRVSQLVYNGSGCSKNDPSIPPPQLSFTIAKLAALSLPSTMRAYLMPNGPLADARKFCQITATIEHDPAFQYTIKRVSHRGLLQLDKSVTGTLKSTVYYQGGDGQSTSQVDLQGPLPEQSFYKQVPMSQELWSPCGTSSTINIKTEVRVGIPEDAGDVAMVDTNQSTQFYVLEWRRCA